MLVLASQSPRRAEILRQAGIAFTVRPSFVNETPRETERPVDYVQRLAEDKAATIAVAVGDIVLGADTTVVVDGRMLGKPENEADARRMLTLLAGKRHEVMTGICLRRGEERISDAAITEVWFNPMSAAEIAEYAASGEPLDKAGAYAIQGLASKYIEKIYGCYYNVVGLPISMVYGYLRYFTKSTELPGPL
jgi:septum formation protein